MRRRSHLSVRLEAFSKLPFFPLQYIYLIKFLVLTKAIINKDTLLYFALMAFSRSVAVRLWRPPPLQMEPADAACSDSHKCLLFSAGEAADKELLNAESTCQRQKICAGFACSVLAHAPLLLRVRFVRGNLIALKQLEKMIQNIDSKHLITV